MEADTNFGDEEMDHVRFYIEFVLRWPSKKPWFYYIEKLLTMLADS